MKTAVFLFFLAIGMGASTLCYLMGGIALMAGGMAFLIVGLAALVSICLRIRSDAPETGLVAPA